MKKLIVIVKQFKSGNGPMDVDSRIFDGDTLKPIIGNINEYHVNGYQLGQISSTLLWAVQDIPINNKQELTRLFPGGYEFEYYFVPLYVSQNESVKWWDELPQPFKVNKSIEFGIDIRRRIPKLDLEEMWVSSAMIHFVMRVLKPVDLKQIID
jgi:hypothetical protein